jgi:hypothetical protein
MSSERLDMSEVTDLVELRQAILVSVLELQCALIVLCCERIFACDVAGQDLAQQCPSMHTKRSPASGAAGVCLDGRPPLDAGGAVADGLVIAAELDIDQCAVRVVEYNLASGLRAGMLAA